MSLLFHRIHDGIWTRYQLGRQGGVGKDAVKQERTGVGHTGLTKRDMAAVIGSLPSVMKVDGFDVL